MASPPSATIDAAPQAGQNISHEGKDYTTIKEGLAHILVPHDIPTSTDPKLSKEDTQKQQVFYNPIQQFNRDLTVLAIKTFGLDTIVRKEVKHEQGLKRAERKKNRDKNRASEKEQNEQAQPEEDELSKKRKLSQAEDVATGSEERPTKKTKSGHVGEEVVVEGGQNGIQNGIQGEPAGNNSVWRPPFTILDALSATGLRALRFAQEIPFVTSVIANDMSEKATASIALNIKHNKLEDKVKANTGNAMAHMYSFVDKKGYDVIDLDPYGTAAPFIDSAIQAINDEGMLCVTCTDSAIFASHGYLEKTYSQYGGLPFKGEPCHEGGLRLILHAIASSAARYGMAIEPLLSLSIDYYVRVFVRVRKAPSDVKLLAGKTMIVYHCETGCGAWTTQFLARNRVQKNKNGAEFSKHSFAHGPSTNQNCEHCGFKTHLSGPMYGGPLHNVEFIKRILAQLKEVDRETYPTMDRIEGMLHTAMEEITFGVENGKKNQEPEQLDPLIPKADPAEVDHHPFFIIPSSISKIVHCSAPGIAPLRGALRHAGFRVTMSHCKPGSVKTDASWKDVWHVILEWVRQKAPLKKELKKGTAGRAIMSKKLIFPAPAKIHDEPAETNKTAEQANSTEDVVMEDARPSNDEKDVVEKAKGDRPSYLGVDFEVKFDATLGRDRDRGKYVRYQLAPRENWGPMSRAK